MSSLGSDLLNTVVELINAFLVIVIIFGMLYLAKQDWGTGFTIFLVAGIMLFFATYIQKRF